MILTISTEATDQEIEQLVKRLEGMGFKVTAHFENNNRSLAVIGREDTMLSINDFSSLPFVTLVLPFNYPFKLASKEFKKKKVSIGY